MLNEWKLCKYDNFTLTDVDSIKSGKKSFANTIICLDTETSHNHNEDNPVGWIYQWSFSYHKQLVYGRNPTQFIEALEKLKNISNDKIIIYVHNLSYDIQYLKQFLIEKYGNDYKILAIKPHKFISFEIDQFVFRCSYMLTNKSLAKLSKDLNVKHKKLVGAIDYDMIRHQNTPLNKNDWKYMFYDVVCLHECIEKLLTLENKNLASVPLTSTGFVRLDGLNKSRSNKKWYYKFRDTGLTEEQYLFCKRAFAGALTHGNFNHVNKIVKGNIKHFDFTSHYPTQQRCKDFPIGKFNLLGNNLTIKQIKRYARQYCIIMNITLKNPRIRDNTITLPYLQESKCREQMATGTKIIAENGRVLRVDGYVNICITEIDLDIIQSQYKTDGYIIHKAYCSIKGRLPNWFFEFVDTFFKEKSDYKFQVKHSKTENERIESELSLMKSKNRLNGIYGLTATDIVRSDINMDENGEWSEIPPKDITETLKKYYASRNHYLPYQWGIYTTAHARHELIELVQDVIGYENYIYCDTDSCFFIDDENDTIEKRIDEWNKNQRDIADNEKQYIINNNGEKVYYHSFEKENEKITQFKFLHAKCYAYITDDNKLHCTIAGVTARKGKTTREKELGAIENLTDGKVFVACGGTKAKYVEDVPYIDENGNEVASACIITPTEKTLSSKIEYQLEQYELSIDE